MNGLLAAIKAFVLKSRPAYKDDLGNGKYDVNKLPEECLPDDIVRTQRIVEFENGINNEIQDILSSSKVFHKVVLDSNLYDNTIDPFAQYNCVLIIRDPAPDKHIGSGTYFVPRQVPRKISLANNEFVMGNCHEVFCYDAEYGWGLLRIEINGFGVFIPNAPEENKNFGSLFSPCYLINSSTPNSTKKFKIAVDDSGTLSATKVT